MSTALLRCSLGDLPILAGGMRLPTGRVWSAVLEAHAEAELVARSPASIVLTREDGTEDAFVGAVRKSALNDGRAQLSVTVVGGRGLLATTIPARDHDKGATEIPVGLLAAGIVADAGELLADGVVAALDALTVPHWHRVAGPASAALDLLVSVVGHGLVWRVLPSGKVWVGGETWPAGPDLRRLGYQLEDGARRYGPDAGQVLPGQLLEDRRVVDVVYHLGGPLRCEARAVVPGDLAHAPDVELYRRTYDATVVSQAATGELELACEDDRVGALRGVSFRVGVPGCKVSLPVGAWVRLGFIAADPRSPYACAPDQDADATQALALVGDAVDCGTLSVTAPPGGGACAISWTAPGVNNIGQITASMTGGRVTGPGHKHIKGVSGP